MVIALVLISLCLLTPSDSSSRGFAITTRPLTSSSYPLEIWHVTPLGPMPSPASSPGYDDFVSSPPLSKHRQKKSPAVPPVSFNPPEDRDCGEIDCTGPYTQTPIGSPCGCVMPIRVVIDVAVDSYVLFNLVQELEVEVAGGTYLKQSQVKITSALASPRGQGKTEVTLCLVPLGHKFDNTTASLIYERFWKKKVMINKSLFHGYDVIYVHYPGLPLSPPPSIQQSSESSAFEPSAAGSSPYPFTADVPDENTQKINVRVISIIALSSCILIILCIGIAIFILKSGKVSGQAAVPGRATSSIARRSGIRSLIPNSAANSTPMSSISTMATYPTSVKTFSLSELEKATESFSSIRKLGEGGSGCVYHGIMEDGSEVAVKLLKKTTQGRDHESEFVSEVEMLSRLHHRNLVKLIGISIEGHRRCLVYELVPNGSVESHLHGADKGKPLTWDVRMKIALGSARALAYLHEDSNPSVIHRDFKASNVLLEKDFTPKVSDFGLAKEASDGKHHVSTRVMGTFGYVAPEYAMTGHLLIKSDVYSYGVVLLELLSGRKPVHMNNLQDPENLVVWARPLLGSREGINLLVDPYLRDNCDNFDNIAQVAAVALTCVHEDPSQRPFMGEVVQALKLVCSNREEVCEGSLNHKESSISSFGFENDFNGDFAPDSSWWSGPYVHDSSLLMNIEYSLDSVDKMQRPHSVLGLMGKPEPIGGYLGPSRTKRKKQQLQFYKWRGSVSEHGSPSLHSHMDEF